MDRLMVKYGGRVNYVCQECGRMAPVRPGMRGMGWRVKMSGFGFVTECLCPECARRREGHGEAQEERSPEA